MNQRVLTCILCPNGCELSVSWKGEPTDESIVVRDNLCPRGVSYALEELTHPTRTLTTSVRVRGGIQPLVSVKTASPIPREALSATRECLRRIILEAPISIGDLVLRDAAGTGIDIVATRTVARNTAANPNRFAGVPGQKESS